MAKYFYFLCVLLISVSLIILGFTSCSGSNTIATSSSRRTSTSRNTSSSSSDDKEKDDGDPCRDSDSCEETCKDIYDAFAEANECMDEGRDKVGRLDKVFKHLKSGDYSELEDISEEDNDVDMDDFEDYLAIGVSGWVAEIRGFTPDKLTDTLRWLVDNSNVAEVLQDNEDGGLDVLETLLKELPKTSSDTTQQTRAKKLHIGQTGHGTSSNKVDCTETSHKFRWFSTFGSGNQLTYCENTTASGADDISFDSSSDKNLYNALSVIYLTISDHLNIFSHSAEEKEHGGEIIFDMAYLLLDKVCSRVSGDGPIICKRAMFCWTHFINNTSEDNYSDSKYNDLVKKYETHLEGSSSGHSDYDECNPGDFENI